MNTLKKLFIALIGVMLISGCFSTTVNASELVQLEEIDEAALLETDETYEEDIDELTINESEITDLEEFEFIDIYDEEDESVIDEIDITQTANEKNDALQTEESAKSDTSAVADTSKDTGETQKAKETDNESKKANTKSSKSTKNNDSKNESKPTYSESDLRLLASLVYAEAGNQSYEGMLAVANVVLNRVKSPVYSHANTIEEVIYDRKWSVQFSVTIKNSKTGKSVLDQALECYDTGVFPGKNPEAAKKAMKRAIKAAKAALNGENNIGNFLCFTAYNSKSSKIKKKYEYKIIGNHIFYRTK